MGRLHFRLPYLREQLNAPTITYIKYAPLIVQ